MKNNPEKNCVSIAGIENHLTKSRNGVIFVLESVDSTNTYLKKQVVENRANAGDCVIAIRQTGGRGRLGRSFSSESEKGLYLSYLMALDGVPSSEYSQVTARVAVAVRDAVTEFCGIAPQIKWVNDLVCESKKLCGILTELSFSGNSPNKAYAVIGIGINVNHTKKDFPAEISDIATSLRLMTDKESELSRLCAALIEKLDTLSVDFPDNKEYYLSQYRKSCAVLGKRVRIIKGETGRTGTAVDIDENFGLIIDFDDGNRSTVTDGDVSVRGFYGYI